MNTHTKKKIERMKITWNQMQNGAKRSTTKKTPRKEVRKKKPKSAQSSESFLAFELHKLEKVSCLAMWCSRQFFMFFFLFLFLSLHCEDDTTNNNKKDCKISRLHIYLNTDYPFCWTKSRFVWKIMHYIKLKWKTKKKLTHTQTEAQLNATSDKNNWISSYLELLVFFCCCCRCLSFFSLSLSFGVFIFRQLIFDSVIRWDFNHYFRLALHLA